MSADATAWVYRHSPFNGATFQVHHAIGDSVNDLHRNEFWMSAARLATKARVSVRTARSAVHEIADAGFIELIEEHTHRPSRYRFLFPDVPVVYEARYAAVAALQSETPRAANDRAKQAEGLQPVQPNPSNYITQDEKPNADAEFARFWATYPRRTAKPDAHRAWTRALKRADAETIIAGAARFAADPNRDDRYTPHPATWLNGDRWNDPPLPPRAGVTRSARSMAAIDNVIGRISPNGDQKGIGQ